MILQALQKDYYNKPIFWPSDPARNTQMLTFLASEIDAEIASWVKSGNTLPLFEYLGFKSLLEYCSYALYHQSLIISLKRGAASFEEIFDVKSLSHANLIMYLPSRDIFQKLAALRIIPYNQLFKAYLKKFFPIFVDDNSSISIEIGWFGLAEKMIRKMNVRANMLPYGRDLTPFKIISLDPVIHGNQIKMSYQHVDGIKNLAGYDTLDILSNTCDMSISICHKCGKHHKDHLIAC